MGLKKVQGPRRSQHSFFEGTFPKGDFGENLVGVRKGWKGENSRDPLKIWGGVKKVGSNLLH